MIALNNHIAIQIHRDSGIPPEASRSNSVPGDIIVVSELNHTSLCSHLASPKMLSFPKAFFLILLGFITLGYSALTTANPITDENALQGQASGWADWDASNQLVEAYASEVSVLPGANLHLHVSTKPSASYRVEVFRIGWYGGDGARLMLCIPNCQSGTPTPGAPQQVPVADPTTGLINANWPITDSVSIGSNWVSGYYVAKIRLTGSTNGVATVPFIVLPNASQSKTALVQVPVNTWQAYNNWGGKSLYDNNSSGGRASKVSFNRPYARTNWSLFDYEIQMVRFLEREGYDIAYQTDWDTHNNPGGLQTYRLLMPIGHGEYWTKEMRDGYEVARDAGTNLAFFGSNMAYWQMRYEDAGRAIAAY